MDRSYVCLHCPLKKKKVHSTVTKIKRVIQVLDLIIGRFQRWRLGSNGDRLGTASILGRGKAAERKDRGRKGATFPSDSFSFPYLPAIPHTAPHQPSCFLLQSVLAPEAPHRPGGFWRGVGVSRGIEGEVQSCSPRLLHYPSAVCLPLPALTVKTHRTLPFYTAQIYFPLAGRFPPPTCL